MRQKGITILPQRSAFLAVVLCACLALLATSCSNPNITEPEKKKTRHFFNEYKDTLIKVDALNRSLETNFKFNSLGKPIGVSGTPYWLVTVGGWHINDRNILLQGEAFRQGNPFYPNPVRNTEVEFKGPFTGLILFNQETGAYRWVIPNTNSREGLKYQRTKDFHLLVLEESDTTLRFYEITSNTAFEVSPSEQIAEWSVNDQTNEIVLFVGTEDKMDVVKYSIAEQVNFDEND